MHVCFPFKNLPSCVRCWSCMFRMYSFIILYFLINYINCANVFIKVKIKISRENNDPCVIGLI